MHKNLGYKAMLRDQLPETIDLALRWMQSKNKWIDHVYSSFIGIYVSKEDRNSATRVILGLSKRGRNFDFHKTINWDNLNQEEKEEWKNIEGWVTWFQSNIAYIHNALDIQNSNSYINKFNELSKMTAFSEIDSQWKDSLIDFIIKNKI